MAKMQTPIFSAILANVNATDDDCLGLQPSIDRESRTRKRTFKVMRVRSSFMTVLVEADLTKQDKKLVRFLGYVEIVASEHVLILVHPKVHHPGKDGCKE